MLNNVTTTYNNDDGDNEGGDDGRGGLIIDRNDVDDGGVGSDFDNKLNKDGGLTQ